MKGKLTSILMIALALVAFAAVSAWALGTPVNTVITNTATLNYKDVNGNSKDPVTDSVTTTVTALYGVNVAPESYTETTEDKTREYAFTVTNTANAPDTISLAITANTLGWTVVIYPDLDGDGVLDAAEITAGATNSTGVLAADGTYKVIVQVTAPTAAVLNATEQVVLTATSAGDSGKSDTGTINLTIQQATLIFTKVASTTTPVPLSNYTYTITVQNTSTTTPAYNVVVTDDLSNYVNHVSTVVAGGSVNTYTYGGDPGGLVTATIGTIAASSTATVTITVYVTGEVPQGSTVSNSAHLAYTDDPTTNNAPNGNPYTADASSTDGTVAELTGVDVTTTAADSYVDPGDVIIIPFTVTNTGNGPENFNLTYTDNGSMPLTWTFYDTWTDGGIIGVIEPGELSNPVTVTGELPKDGTNTLYAMATVPTTATDTTYSNVTITATSATVPGTTDSVTIKDTVKAPILTLDKSVDKATAQPHETLTYTLVIKNTGTGDATVVTLVDAIPANTTYVAGSIYVKQDAGLFVLQTDGDDTDYAKFNANTITVVIPTVAGDPIPQVSGDEPTWTITFQVTIN